MLSIYLTCKDKQEAERIAKELLRKRLIACANIFPIASLYRWKGKIEKAKEVAVILKTKKEMFEEAAAIIKRLHSYEVPCICAGESSEVSKEYAAYLEKEVK
ncbi:divalent-cation tolerance protein CutA [Candidatus Woesearchaeota archaeon]|nr:divalent-cation tolerance protein CutA [Candidatus Woesearchaeota archaeon]